MAFTNWHIDGRRALVSVALTLSLGSPAWNAVAQAQQNQQASVRTDAQLQTDIAAALSASPVLNGQEVNAAVASGQVTLSGYVDDQASKDLAQIVVSKVNGVRTVINNLTVVPIGAPASDQSDQGTATDPQNGQQTSPDVAEQQQQAPATQYPPDTNTARAPYPGGQAAQGQYPQQQYPQQQNQDQYPQQENSSQMQTIPVQLPSGTLLNVRLTSLLDTKQSAPGSYFQATSANDISIGEVLTVPRGAIFTGQVVEVLSTKGSLSGHSALSLRLTSLTIDGRTYPLNTDVWVGNGPGKGGYSAGNTITGATIGAVIGGIAGGGAGAAIGATIGGATGAVASSASSTPRVVLPPETKITFHLATPIFVTPVSSQQMQRLSQAQPANGPAVTHRVGYPAPPVVYGYPYPYAAPYPYAYAYGYPYRAYYYPRYRVYYRPYR